MIVDVQPERTRLRDATQVWLTSASVQSIRLLTLSREETCSCVWFFSVTPTAYTHGLHREISIPDGDVMVHAGEFCSEGEAVEARSFGEFFRGLPHRHKVVIAEPLMHMAPVRSTCCR